MADTKANTNLQMSEYYVPDRRDVVSTDNTIRPGLNLMSTCAIAIVLPGVWIFGASTLVTGIFGGGPPIAIWGTLGVGIALSIFCSSLAEYASAFPSAAGCTHIASQVASPAWAPFTSYATGSIHSWAVLFTPPALLIACMNLLFTCVCVMRPDYEPQKWHIFLAYETANVGFFLLIKYGTVILSFLMELGMVAFALAFFVTIGVVVGLSKDITRPSNESIWSLFDNQTGFNSPVIAALLGLTGPFYAFGPVHWLLNMADDIENPSRNIPLGLVAQQVGGTATLFAFYVVAYYSVTNYDAIISSSLPSIVGELYQQATGRPGVTLILLILLLILSVIALVGYISAAIRLLYGFGRTGSLTHAQWWSKIDVKHNIPINALIASTACNFVLGFVYLASPVGFTILLGSAQALFALGYLPILFACVFTGRRYFNINLKRCNPDRKPFYSLGHALGLACDIFSLILQLALVVIYCLPTAAPITAANFNWTSLFLAFVVGVTAIGWIFHGQRHISAEVLVGVPRSAQALALDEVSPCEPLSKEVASTVV